MHLELLNLADVHAGDYLEQNLSRRCSVLKEGTRKEKEKSTGKQYAVQTQAQTQVTFWKSKQQGSPEAGGDAAAEVVLGQVQVIQVGQQAKVVGQCPGDQVGADLELPELFHVAQESRHCACQLQADQRLRFQVLACMHAVVQR